jgi:hypothetical protein
MAEEWLGVLQYPSTAPAESVILRFAWSPAPERIRATYRAEVIQYEVDGDRYVCRLMELFTVERSGSGQAVSDERLRDLVGKYVRVPGEALNGDVLPLKMSTLTGDLARPYFFDTKPNP